MSKIRLALTIICLFGFAICALWAAPNRTPKQRAQDKCDVAYNNCETKCEGGSYVGAGRVICHRHCSDNLDACYKKAGIEAPLRANLPPGGVPTASVASTPKVSPTPNRLQPQGTLIRVSPTPTPHNDKKKKN
jgi:hypothetical protein